MLEGYERYRLEWMISHGWSIEDLVRSVENYARCNGRFESFSEAFRHWEFDCGFGGELWCCEGEWEEFEGGPGRR